MRVDSAVGTGPDAEPIAAARIDHPAGSTVASHHHASGQLSVVRQGTMTVTADEGWWLAPPGLAIWVPPHLSHGARYSESSSLINVHMPVSLSGGLPVTCEVLPASELLLQLALEAERVTRAADASTHRPIAVLIGALMVEHLRAPSTRPRLFVPHGHDRRLRAVTDLLRLHPGSDWTLTRLAAHANTSARTLARLFIEETGMPFGRWREHLRIVMGVDMLARGETITTTAMALGYASASSFTTLFTRLLGAPPRRYMASVTS
ncbi:AraC family transcriptional regulator [Luteibacter sp. 9135]|uniref:AraC family transcriptional regulator n=1 Tax=Luteibacter sp. 9135 TaxID=1500893 RepID=UPI0009DDC7D3|nr:AraC family transcriptional regulator [Luteibacter sp. 9135]